MRVAAVQYSAGRTASLADFMQRVTAIAERCAGTGADVVLLPEYVCVDLMPELLRRNLVPPQAGLREALLHLPELNGELFDGLAAAAKSTEVVLAAGTYLDRTADGKIYNCAHVFLPDGRRIVQPKMHVAYELRANAADVSPGDVITVWETAGCRTATLVCYDAQFPESARALLDAGGIDLILVPGCALEPWGISRMRLAAAARAMESFTFAATAHLVGEVPVPGGERLVFWGRSAVFGPVSRPFPVDGVLADATHGDDAMVVADLDLDLLRSCRANGFPKYRDRRDRLPVRYR